MKYDKPKPSAWQNNSVKPQGWGKKEAYKPGNPTRQIYNDVETQEHISSPENAEVKLNRWAKKQISVSNDPTQSSASVNNTEAFTELSPTEAEYDYNSSGVYDEPFPDKPENETCINTSDNKPGGSQKTVTALFALVLVLIVLLCVIIVFLLSERGADRNSYQTEATTELTMKETTEAAETETTLKETTVPTTEPTTEFTETSAPISPVASNAGNYTGYWYVKGVEEKELKINFIGDNEVNFTLSYFRLDSMDNVTATLNGSTASFLYTDYGSKIKGTLTFNKNSVTVSITQSDNDNIPAETITFNTRQRPSPEEATTKTQTVTSPDTANNASAEFETIVVNDVEFVYPRTYSDESITFAVNSLEINLLHSYSSEMFEDEYELKIDGTISDKKNRAAYLTYYVYDENGYLLGKYMFSSSRVNGSFKERHPFTLEKSAARVVIDMGIGS